MSEPYLELYKKYRPETWDAIVGQEIVVKNLRNAVVKGRIPTLYGFFGERGTGKSSSAYLLAKAINCDNLQKDGNPCGQCENCKSMQTGSLPNVHFVSMANDGSVDNIRKIVQDARMCSFNGKKQVWVLDEVHNLSKAAFDSLLVPLDDNDMSKSALFIMCSTAPEKIPDTLLSRARVFKFTPVSKEVLTKHLQKIASLEKIDIPNLDTVIDNAVRNGRGSVRETLSLFDNALEGTLNEQSYYDEQILYALARQNLPQAFKAVSIATEQGYDGRVIAEQMFADLRDLLLVNAGANVKDTTLPVSDDKAVKLIKAFFGDTGLVALADCFGSALSQMSPYGDPRIKLEISLVKSVKLLKSLKSKANGTH